MEKATIWLDKRWVKQVLALVSPPEISKPAKAPCISRKVKGVEKQDAFLNSRVNKRSGISGVP